MRKLKNTFYPLLLAFVLMLGGCSGTAVSVETTTAYEQTLETTTAVPSIASSQITLTELSAAEKEAVLAAVPEYSGSPFAVVNNNMPFFSEADLTTDSFEFYSELDDLGRCGTAYACIGQDLMPTEERGEIGKIKPSGWHTVKYDCIADRYLYNRCHLIGFQLAGENANVKNLITGTRYLNIEGMLPFENDVADYVQSSANHVLYRVTPIFENDNLVADGVLMEAISVEDKGIGILFNVYCYNVQPGVQIDYATGDSHETDKTAETAVIAETPAETASTTSDTVTYILNTNTHKFHYPSCSSVDDMKEKNKQVFYGSRDEAIAQGYDPCGRCHP